MPVLEAIPASLAPLLSGGISEGRIHVAVATDLLAHGGFGEEWLVVTDDHVRVYAAGDPASSVRRA